MHGWSDNDEEVQWSINPLEEKTDKEEIHASSAEIEILPLDDNNNTIVSNTIDVNKLLEENKLLKLRIVRKDEIIRKLKEGWSE